MAWKDLLRNLRPAGKDAPDEARDLPPSADPKPEPKSVSRRPAKRTLPSVPGVSSSASASASASAASPSTGSSPKPLKPKSVPETPRQDRRPDSDPARPASAGESVPGLSVRKKGDPVHSSGRIVQSNRNDTAYEHKSSAVEFIHRRYEEYGDTIASAVLIYALQPGGLQRLVARIGGEPWNNDHLDHEAILNFLREQGPEAFCGKIGVRYKAESPASPGEARPSASLPEVLPSVSQAKARPVEAIPNDSPRARKLPSASKTTPPGAGAGAGTASRIKLEGNPFQGVKIDTSSHRRGSMGGLGDYDPPTGPPPQAAAVAARPVAGVPSGPSTPPPPPRRQPVDDWDEITPPPSPVPRPPTQPPQAAVSAEASPPASSGNAGVWRVKPALGDADTQELANKSPARPKTGVPASSADQPTNSPANEYLRKIIQEHTRNFLSPREDGDKSGE